MSVGCTNISYRRTHVKSNLLVPPNISRTVIRTLSRECIWVSLYAVRIKYLHDPAEVNILHEIINIGIPHVVTEDQQSLLDALSLSERNYEMAQVGKSIVDLDNYYRRIRSKRTESLLVENSLLQIHALDLMAHFCYVTIAQVTVAGHFSSANRAVDPTQGG